MDRRRRDLVLTLCAVALAVASLRPIRSYDFFWHLASGRWIAEHHALPLNDPFAVASDRGPWVNGEWLFQLPAWEMWLAGGPPLASVLRAASIALIFTIAAACAGAESVLAAAAIAFIGWLGCADLLGERPATIGVLLFIVVLRMNIGRPSRRLALRQALLTVVWINVHPSALLSPVISGLRAVAVLGDPPEERRASLSAALQSAVLSLVALLVNPYGLRAVTAPLHLAGAVQAGGFVNREWLPSLPSTFPLLYVTMAASLALIVFRPGQQRLARTAFALFLAVLAVRFVRNQPFWFAAMAPLVVPSLPAIRPGMQRLFAAVAGVVLLTSLAARPPRTGVDRRYFPVAAIQQLRASPAPGNIFNADQFGGYLIWSFYPQRRVLVDGRNELFATYLAEYEKARRDSRLWDALLRKYQVGVAVDEYRREMIDVLDPRSGAHQAAAASEVFFPRSRWALVAFDDVAMVFVRREGRVPFEYRVLVPDDPERKWPDEGTRREAIRELEIARERVGESSRIDAMAESLAR